MNYEEKYKEALERAKKLHDSYNLMHISVDEIEQIFPELAESEDERIRKEIVSALKFANDGGVYDKHIAYLEKQKAKEKQDRMMPVYNDRDSFESALDKAWKSYNESGARTVDGCEDDYVECAHAKGFREGYLFGLETSKVCYGPKGDPDPAGVWKPSEEQMMKEAVEAEITVGRLPDDWSLAYNPDELHRALLKFKSGDKVKIIIVKQ